MHCRLFDLDRRFSAVFDDKRGLVIDPILFPDPPQVFILLHCAREDCVTNLLRRLMFVRADHLFQAPAVLFIAAVVDSIRIQENNVSGTH